MGVWFLSCELVVSDEYKGNVIGLMGNFDGDKNNDFIFLDGFIFIGSVVNLERNIYNNFG